MSSFVETNRYGVPLSKYYPKVSLSNIVIGESITLNCDIGKFKKGDVISDSQDMKTLMIELLNNLQSTVSEIQVLKETIKEQEEIIKNLQESGSTSTAQWPDIHEIYGGGSEDLGEDGGTDSVTFSN